MNDGRQDFIRPSAMGAIELCPGRPLMEARACAQVPMLRNWTSEVARRGTLAHEVLAAVIADCFRGDWTQAPQVINGLEGRMIGLTDWAKDAVRHCLSWVCDVVRNLTNDYPGLRTEVAVELHLDTSRMGIARGGSADVVITGTSPVGPCRWVHVIDHKTGFVWQGEAADHLQLAAYAVAAYDRFKPTNGVVVHLAMGRRHELTSAHYDADAIARSRIRLRRAAAAALVAEPPLHPSPDACKFCKALPFCRVARDHAMHAADRFALLGAEPEDRMRLRDDATIAERFAKAAKELCKTWVAAESTTTRSTR